MASSFIFPAPQPSRNVHSQERTRIPSTFHPSTPAHTSGPGFLFANSTPPFIRSFPELS